MTQYRTNNPLGSMAPRDLYDNAQNVDNWSNGEEPFYEDRFGVMRRSFSGMNFEFEAAQTGRTAAFNTQMASLGYVSKGAYAAGVVLARHVEYVAVPGAVSGGTPAFYRPSPDATVPLTLTGDWAIDGPLLVMMSADDVFRQDMAAPSGASLIGVKKSAAGPTARTRTQADINNEQVTLNDFNDIPDAIAWSMGGSGQRSIVLPSGNLDMSGKKFILPANQTEPVKPLRFISNGGTTIYKDDAGYLFDCSGDYFYDLFVENIDFESAMGANVIIFNTDKLIRLMVNSNTFRLVDYVFYGADNTYAQTIRASQNIVRGHKAFMTINRGFDIKCRDNIIEFGDYGYIFRDTAAHCLYNSVIDGDVIESMNHAAIVSGATKGSRFSGIYCEANADIDFQLSNSNNPHQGLEVSNNWFQQSKARVASGGYCINWGNIQGSAKGGGNWCENGNLHNLNSGTGSVEMFGDTVVAGKQLYGGHTTLTDPGRNAVGRAIFTEAGKIVTANGQSYVAMDPMNGAVDFGVRPFSATVGGEIIAPCIETGTTNPQHTPANYGTRKWAAGSEVKNTAPALIGAVGAQYIISGWKCITSGQGGASGSDRWVEMRTTTGT